MAPIPPTILPLILTPRDIPPEITTVTISELNHLRNLQSYYNNIGFLALLIMISITTLIFLFILAQHIYYSQHPDRRLTRKLRFLQDDLRVIVRLGSEGEVGERYRRQGTRIEDHVVRLLEGVRRRERERVYETRRPGRGQGRVRERRGWRWQGLWKWLIFWDREERTRGEGQGRWYGLRRRGGN